MPVLQAALGWVPLAAGCPPPPPQPPSLPPATAAGSHTPPSSPRNTLLLPHPTSPCHTCPTPPPPAPPPAPRSASVHLAAPGDQLLSTIRTGGYGPMSGTSMACPVVAGAAALVQSMAARYGEPTRHYLNCLLLYLIPPPGPACWWRARRLWCSPWLCRTVSACSVVGFIFPLFVACSVVA